MWLSVGERKRVRAKERKRKRSVLAEWLTSWYIAFSDAQTLFPHHGSIYLRPPSLSHGSSQRERQGKARKWGVVYVHEKLLRSTTPGQMWAHREVECANKSRVLNETRVRPNRLSLFHLFLSDSLFFSLFFHEKMRTYSCLSYIIRQVRSQVFHSQNACTWSNVREKYSNSLKN